MLKTSSKEMLGKLGPLLGLFLIVIVITILNPSFMTTDNILNILRQVSISALIAFGMTFVILTGGIDLSVGSTLALTGAVAATMLASGIDPVLTILAALILGAILGAVNGVIIAKGKVAPFIATLATMTIYRGLTLVYTDGRPVSDLGNEITFQMLGKGYFFGIPVPVCTMILAFIALYVIMHKTTFGRRVYAVGGNEAASKLSGINVDRVKIAVYSLTGMLAALSALILTSRLNSAQPTAGTSYELDAIAAVVLGGTSLTGGKGWIFGTLVGALIIGVLNNGLNLIGVSSFFQQVVKGIVILIAVLIDRKKTA
ncbi:Ribose transport system permease protein rbsC [Solibacillus isronensis B3W22]|uniref:Ribose transport system permease protein rbsC n=1 Tax=Solibacillus isronensis B3W22 TaxID=1224748 RepID=K1KI38_9BACL|nr:ribose ABC transporter permease [Solibacillus isronensis]AMO87405.1 ribose ABC transporter permease [Solibacillus silvestris]EKB43730.1 Ribose transport system permease protein rbsC [Solibacillus isronensis B3W22]